MGEEQLRRVKERKRAGGRHRARYWSADGRDKESYTCPDCGDSADEITWWWEVHHIDGDPMNGDDDNLVALCRRCHYLRHGRDPPETLEEWKDRGLSLGGGGE